MWRKGEKLDFIAKQPIPWQTLTPDSSHTWLVPDNADEWKSFMPITDIFSLYTVGVKTNRDSVVYDWNRDKLARRIQTFIEKYNAEVLRRNGKKEGPWPDDIDWSRDLKADALRKRLLKYDEAQLVASLYRAYTRKWLYFDRVLNEEVYKVAEAFASETRALCCCIDSQMPFSVQLTSVIPSHAPGGRPGQCFPEAHLNTEAVRRFQAYYGVALSAADVFVYCYAVMHHRGYRAEFADPLRFSLPRIPFAPDFWAFANAGKQLADLHLHYEQAPQYPVKEVWNKIPWSEARYVTKMKLSPDKTSLVVNSALTLEGIPPETFDYRLGSRSALEWVIDQYQVKGDSDPNREDDPDYVIRLVKQVIHVSIETVKIVNNLPREFSANASEGGVV